MEIINVVRHINSGGFGTIDEVICDDGRNYARKTFSPIPDSRLTPELISKFRSRFIREVETQRRLPNEYVMPILSYDLDATSPWYIMPLADYDYNHEIRECRQAGRSPDGLSDILNAMECLHNLGYVHRDLKPGNILFHNGVWKLSDMGLITQDKDILSLSITSSNGLGYGSEMYAAPEQINEFKNVDSRADIYAFGAILHDIFGTVRRTPYSNHTAFGDIGVIIDKCTKREPRQRFSSVESLRNRLLYVLAKQTNPTASAGSATYIQSLREIETFTLEQFQELVFYVKDEEADKHSIFYELNREIINRLYELDKDLFIEFCLEYVYWVEITRFSFDYCDVIIRHLQDIYGRPVGIDLKAKCALAAAELANKHNRWFVMANVVRMSDHAIHENFALRLQIDIDMNIRAKENFRRCVAGINQTISSYHPLIASIL